MEHKKGSIKYSWEQLEEDCKSISKQIKDIETSFGCIVAITVGGLIPATLIAKMLGIKEIYTIGYESYEDKKQTKLKRTTSLYDFLMHRNLILVDDISDTGRTLEKVKKILKEKENNVLTATLHYKSTTRCHPYISAKKITNWIEYPWEKYEK